MSPTPARKIPCFKAGRHTAMDGAVYEFTPADLAAMAGRYSTALHRAPLVKGHPKTADPAFGYAERFALTGDTLIADPADVDPDFAEEVRAGRWLAVSLSLFHPDSPSNPTPGDWYPRHLGFLGAHAPAVPGLPRPEFAAPPGPIEPGVVSFAESIDLAPPAPHPNGDHSMSDQDKHPAPADKKAAQDAIDFAEREAKLQADAEALAQKEAAIDKREQALAEQAETRRKADNTDFAEQLVKGQDLAPHLTARIAAVLDGESGPADAEVSFAEGDEIKRQAYGTLLRETLKAMADPANHINFGEHAGGGGDAADEEARIEGAARTMAGLPPKKEG